jgi:hypothetical protein
MTKKLEVRTLGAIETDKCHRRHIVIKSMGLRIVQIVTHSSKNVHVHEAESKSAGSLLQNAREDLISPVYHANLVSTDGGGGLEANPSFGEIPLLATFADTVFPGVKSGWLHCQWPTPLMPKAELVSAQVLNTFD